MTAQAGETDQLYVESPPHSAFENVLDGMTVVVMPEALPSGDTVNSIVFGNLGEYRLSYYRNGQKIEGVPKSLFTAGIPAMLHIRASASGAGYVTTQTAVLLNPAIRQMKEQCLKKTQCRMSQNTIVLSDDELNTWQSLLDRTILIVPDETNTSKVVYLQPKSTVADNNLYILNSQGELSSSIPVGAIKAGYPMLLHIVQEGTQWKPIWLNYSAGFEPIFPVETTLPEVLEVGKHYQISFTDGITINLPDSANDKDRIKVDYYNAGTVTKSVIWKTASTVGTNAPILSNNIASGGIASCTVKSLHSADCWYSSLAGKWIVDIEKMVTIMK